MRVIHRYLGFFLAGVMIVYAMSGIVLIFRTTNTFKVEKQVERKLNPNIEPAKLGEVLRIRGFKVIKTEGAITTFETGTYNSETGLANYTSMELPFVLDKLTHLHKATTNDTLFFLNIFFGLSLFFFAVSSFWMFAPRTKVFRQGLYYTLAGIILTLIILFVNG